MGAEDGGHDEGRRTRVAGTTTEKMLEPLHKCMRNSTWKEKLASAYLETKLTGSCVLGYAEVDAGTKDGSYGKDQELHASGGVGRQATLKLKAETTTENCEFEGAAGEDFSLLSIHRDRRTHVADHARMRSSSRRCRTRLVSTSNKLTT